MGFVRANREEWTGDNEIRYWRNDSHLGEVAAFEVLEFEPKRKNDWNEYADAVLVNITITSGEDKGLLYEREWLQPGVWVKTLKNHVGDTYVARITKGGKAYLFEEPTDEEYAEAERVVLGSGSPAASSAPPF